MGRIELLREDHQQLQHRLTVLEGALQGMGRPDIVRSMCHSLACFLRQHIEREEQLCSPHRLPVEPSLNERLLHDHGDEWELLECLQALCASRIRRSGGAVMCHLAHLVDGVREHMDHEAYGVFPSIEHAAHAEQAR